MSDNRCDRRRNRPAKPPVVIGRRGVWTVLDMRGFGDREVDRLAAVLDDDRVCVSAAPWFGGSQTKAMKAVEEWDNPVAWMECRGAMLVETRVLRCAATSQPDYELDEIEAAARAAVVGIRRFPPT